MNQLTAAPQDQLHNVKALDGIRGVAVLLVMLFHFGYLAAGWIGVQIFFALSGFLITRILIFESEGHSGNFFARFYWRRSLRILPVIVVFLAINLFAYILIGRPESLPSDFIWLATFTANFARMRDGDLGSAFVPLWSLAVEEQFYLIWPLLVYFLPLATFRKVVFCVLILTPAVRFVIFQYLTAYGYGAEYAGKASYVLPFTQFDAFAAGAAIPLWRLDRLRRVGALFCAAVGLAGLAGLGVLAYLHHTRGANFFTLGFPHYLIPAYGYVWGYSLLNLCSALGIVYAIQKTSPSLVLENSFVVWVGKVSYCVYVIHVPVLLAGNSVAASLGIDLHGIVRHGFFIMWCVAVFLISGISYKWLEGPMLKFKDKRFARSQSSR